MAPARPNAWIVGTRKGAWALRRTGPGPLDWTAGEPWFFGCDVHHVVQDPRGDGTILATVKTGHLGPTVYRSTDGGRTWTESTKPPRFKTPAEYTAEGSSLPEDDPRRKGRTVDHVFFLAPGHASTPGRWYAGTSGIGLFRSDDDGVTWHAVDGFNDHGPLRVWAHDLSEMTPDGAKCHSVQVHPADPRRIVLGLSGGGAFVSPDDGATWTPVNLGIAMDFAPPKTDGTEYEFGHDIHDLVVHPAQPSRWYHQNHCGMYRLDWNDDAAKQRWVRIGDNMPKDVGDIGFPMTCHPRNPDVCWVVPMDGGTVWPRVSPGGKPAVYGTRDGGATWRRLDRGLPPTAWYTVLRQAMAHDGCDPLGLAFGTTSGDVWFSGDEGDTWHSVLRHMPKVQSITAGRLA
ncbi:MAG: glycosyl hydrolase [Planctomycetes bacterium]|nr:glycosyl hydrolase [Planctomycetota bacterium]